MALVGGEVAIVIAEVLLSCLGEQLLSVDQCYWELEALGDAHKHFLALFCVVFVVEARDFNVLEFLFK